MGDRILGIISLAVIGAMLGDALAHGPATASFLSNINQLLSSTYKAAAGGFSQ